MPLGLHYKDGVGGISYWKGVVRLRWQVRKRALAGERCLGMPRSG